MTERASKMGISQEAIDGVDRRSAAFERTIPSYIRVVYGRIKTEQKELFDYIKQEHKQHSLLQSFRTEYIMTYALGASLTYDMLPDFHTQKPLTSGEIDAMHQSLLEHTIFEESNGEKSPECDLSWFVKKLEKDSPSFLAWLSEASEQIDDDGKKRIFIKGSLQVAMPFYMREEAKEMEQALFR